MSDAVTRSSRRGSGLPRGATLVAAGLLLAVGAASWPGIARRLLGPPAVRATEAYAEDPRGPTFDHSRFDALLHERVSVDGRVDYAALAAQPGGLDEYLKSLGQAPIDTLDRNERLALLINAYNAFTLRLILDHYPLRSIKDIRSRDRWDAERWNLGGKTVSLNQVEHELIRARFKEPRVHFALVCASIGCPPLRNEAYVGRRVEEQLEAQARYVHAHDQWFRFDAREGKVWLTRLYDWYAGDFEQSAGSVPAFAGRYSPELAGTLAAGRAPSIDWLEYDWSLNGWDGKDR